MEAGRLKAVQHKEKEKSKKKSQKQVRWDLAVDPVHAHQIDAEVYGNNNGWWSEPELVERPQRNTLKKKRFRFHL
jgi:hypothetical protein